MYRANNNEQNNSDKQIFFLFIFLHMLSSFQFQLQSDLGKVTFKIVKVVIY